MKSIDEAKEEIFGMKYIPATLDLIEDYIVDEKDAIRAIDIATKPLVREMKRYLPILEALEKEPELWRRFTKGTGVATLNGYRNVIN
jgi:hypothetical protein